GTGGQVVCPGGSSPRQWVGGMVGEPAIVDFSALWEAVCRLAEACGCMPRVVYEAPGVQAPPGGRVHTDKVVDRAIAYLAKCAPAISGAGGHADTYWPARVVCWGFDFGEEEGFRLLWDYFNPRCQPPWTERELRHKCRDADTLSFDKER